MSEDVIAKLEQFTPTSGLDRDELLFRAGRASAPSPRVWKAASGMLTVALLATAVAWGTWPSPEPKFVFVPVEVPAVPPPVSADEAPQSGEPPGASSYFVMSRAVSRGVLPPSEPSGGSSSVPAEILTVGSGSALID